MVYVATEMPQDAPRMGVCLMWDGELRALWRDSQFKGNNEMTTKLWNLILESLRTRIVRIERTVLYIRVHIDNTSANKLAKKLGFELEQTTDKINRWIYPLKEVVK